MVKSNNVLHRSFSLLHDFLDVGVKLQKADCIFVFAGRPERKTYALELYRAGYAKHLIISVGRFEWRRFLQLSLDDYGGLLELVEATPAPRRHFFVHIDQTGTKAFRIPKRRFGTFGEAMALSGFVERLSIKRLVIISNGFHLRRATNVTRKCCASSEIELIPVAVPNALNSGIRKNWWKTSAGFSLILSEYLKNLLYSFLLIPYLQIFRKN